MYAFALQYKHQGREELAVHQVSILDVHIAKFFRKPSEVPEGFIPVGTVQWCEGVLGGCVTPDYYPEFLKDHLFREVWRQDHWPTGRAVFVKPADRYKRFDGFVTKGGYKGMKSGPFWCSGLRTFKNEWRYYVADGKVLEAGWYSGDEEKMPEAPELKIKIPKNYCGALDFGIMSGYPKRFALVEANHPFACGWYGKDHRKYVEWCAKGWNYMLKNHGLKE